MTLASMLFLLVLSALYVSKTSTNDYYIANDCCNACKLTSTLSELMTMTFYTLKCEHYLSKNNCKYLFFVGIRLIGLLKKCVKGNLNLCYRHNITFMYIYLKIYICWHS